MTMSIVMATTLNEQIENLFIELSLYSFFHSFIQSSFPLNRDYVQEEIIL